jgi:hypothetical protein
MVFTALCGSGFQRCSVLGFRVQRLLSSLAGTFQLQLPSWTNWLPIAELIHNAQPTLYVASARTAHKTPLPTVLLLQHSAVGTDSVENTGSQLLQCYALQSCCLAMGVFSEPFPNNGSLLASQFLPWANHATVFSHKRLGINLWALPCVPHSSAVSLSLIPPS